MVKKTIREIIMEDAKLRKTSKDGITAKKCSGCKGSGKYANGDTCGRCEGSGWEISEEEAEKGARAFHGGSFCDFCKAKGPKIKLTPDGTNYACPECMPKKEAGDDDAKETPVEAISRMSQDYEANAATAEGIRDSFNDAITALEDGNNEEAISRLRAAQDEIQIIASATEDEVKVIEDIIKGLEGGK